MAAKTTKPEKKIPAPEMPEILPSAVGAVAYSSSSLDKGQLANYRLTLSVSESKAEYALFNDQREILLLNARENERNLSRNEFLDQVVFDDPTLKQNFKGIDVVSHTTRWLIVPIEHLSDGSDAWYLETQHDIDSNTDSIMRDTIGSLGLTVLFAISQEFHKRAEFYFKKFRIHHVAVPLLHESQRVHIAMGKTASLHIAFFEDGFFCIAFGEQGLLLCNEFSTTHAEDVLYYTLNVLQNLKLNPDLTPLYATGRGELRNKSMQMLQNYFASFVDARSFFPLQPLLNSVGLWHDQFCQLLLKPI